MQLLAYTGNAGASCIETQYDRSATSGVTSSPRCLKRQGSDRLASGDNCGSGLRCCDQFISREFTDRNAPLD